MDREPPAPSSPNVHPYTKAGGSSGTGDVSPLPLQGSHMNHADYTEVIQKDHEGHPGLPCLSRPDKTTVLYRRRPGRSKGPAG